MCIYTYIEIYIYTYHIEYRCPFSLGMSQPWSRNQSDLILGAFCNALDTKLPLDPLDIKDFSLGISLLGRAKLWQHACSLLGDI